MHNELIDDSTKPNGWPCHSSQDGLIKELLGAGVPVTLTYIVTPKVDINKKLEAEFAGKQRL